PRTTSGIFANALDYLHDNVPRAFVNVVEVLDVTLVKELKDGSPTCSVLLGSMLCKCPAFPESEEQEQEIANLQKDYQRLLNELIDSGRYETLDDFTVPFLRDSQPPRINGEIDFDFFAPDCFHFGVRGHSAAGKGLWNNMAYDFAIALHRHEDMFARLCMHIKM
uniref:Phospholipase A2, group VI (cytosolic, calcium-independent) n=1 Tax=Macrostomum lignano TaxID=282301 RepID=A0A1I8IZH0_9PLAT